MENEMTLSVVLPVYNGQDYIQEAIESILNQTFTDFEFIIINDGSTDNSLNIIKAFDDSRIVLIDQENKGLAKTLNIGLNIARGKYIARMDGDDIASFNRFEKQVRYLKEKPNVKLLGTAVDLIDKDGRSICIDAPYTGSRFLKKYLQKVGNPFKHPTVMFDRQLALQIGGYNETIGKYFEDYFLWNEFSHHGDVEIMKDVLLQYRITPGSIMGSVKSKEFSDFMIRIINKRSFDDTDLACMTEIKNRENKTNNIVDKDAIYKKRILSAKTNRSNRIFLKISSLTNISFAISLMSFVKKMRVLIQIK